MYSLFGKYVFILNGADWYRLDSTSLELKHSSELSYTVKKLGDVYNSIAVHENTVCLLSGFNPVSASTIAKLIVFGCVYLSALLFNLHFISFIIGAIIIILRFINNFSFQSLKRRT